MQLYSILQSIDIQDVLWNLGNNAAQYLPESTVLEFLLSVNSPVLKTVEEYLRMYSDMSSSAFWDGKNNIYVYFQGVLNSSKKNIYICI